MSSSSNRPLPLTDLGAALKAAEARLAAAERERDELREALGGARAAGVIERHMSERLLEETNRKLADVQSRLGTASMKRDEARWEALTGQAAAIGERDEARAELADARARLAAVKEERDASQAELHGTQAELADTVHLMAAAKLLLDRAGTEPANVRRDRGSTPPLGPALSDDRRPPPWLPPAAKTGRHQEMERLQQRLFPQVIEIQRDPLANPRECESD